MKRGGRWPLALGAVAVAVVLMSLERPLARAWYRRAIEREAPEERWNAVAQLAARGGAARDVAEEWYLQWLDIPGDTLERWRAVAQLVALGSSEASSHLLAAVEDLDAGVRTRALEILLSVEPSPDHSNDLVRRALAVDPWRLERLALVGRRTDGVVRGLESVVADRAASENLRAAAIECLGLIGGAASSAVPVLEHACDDPALGVRALLTLGRIGSAGVPRLIAALEDDSSDVRLFAAVALGRAGGLAGVARPQLEARLEDPDAGVRAAAREALERITR